MMLINMIYTHFNLTPASAPHYFTLENIAELFIPESAAQQTKMIHIIPINQNISIDYVEAFIKASKKNNAHEYSADIIPSQNSHGVMNFHIVSPNLRDETEAALKLLTFFIEYTSQPHV